MTQDVILGDMATPADFGYMARAIKLARRGLYTTDPNPRVGCVVVRDNQIVGQGWHEFAGGPHAEVSALAQAGEAARDATVYVTLEPCCHHGRTPPCTDALIAAGVVRVIVAMEDPNPRVGGAGLARLRAVGIAVEQGVLQAEAEALNPGHITRMRYDRPYVRCKLAMSLDGRTAMASGESKWITDAPARRDAHRLRARSSAILTGIGTVLADDPALTVRLDGPEFANVRQPLRVVLDPSLSMPKDARMLGMDGCTLIVASAACVTGAETGYGTHADVVPLAGDRDHLDLEALIHLLAQRGVNEVLLEAGATLSGAMLHAGLVDELVVYMAPHLMGDGARGLVHLPSLEVMANRIALDILDVRAVGRDWRIIAKITTQA